LYESLGEGVVQRLWFAERDVAKPMEPKACFPVILFISLIREFFDPALCDGDVISLLTSMDRQYRQL
jgi:hypothetical protein